MAKIGMLSGDLQRPKAAKIRPKKEANLVKSQDCTNNFRSRKYTNMSLGNSFKDNEPIKVDKKDIKKLYT